MEKVRCSRFSTQVIAVPRDGSRKPKLYEGLHDFLSECFPEKVSMKYRLASQLERCGTVDFEGMLIFKQAFKLEDIGKPPKYPKLKPIVLYGNGFISFFRSYPEALEKIGCRKITSKNRFLAFTMLENFDFVAFHEEWRKQYLEMSDLFDKHRKVTDSIIALDENMRFFGAYRTQEEASKAIGRNITKEVLAKSNFKKDDSKKDYMIMTSTDFEFLVNMFPSLCRWIIFGFDDDTFRNFYAPCDRSEWIVGVDEDTHIICVVCSSPERIATNKVSVMGIKDALESGDKYWQCRWHYIPREKATYFMQRKGMVLDDDDLV